MRYAGKPVLVVLVFLFCVVVFFPAFASLRDYGIYMSGINGSTALRLEDKIRKTNGVKTKVRRWVSRTNARTKGFIWDPRFMNFEGGLSYLTNKSETDSGDVDSSTLGFNVAATLFPRWRYPYRPINLFANRSMSTVDAIDGDTQEITSTLFGVRWGLSHKLFGRIRTSYDGQLLESTGGLADRDELRQRFKVRANREFRKGQWGESKLNYGYEFEYWDAKQENTSFLQNYLFARNFTRFGQRTELATDASFYQRTNDTGGSGNRDDDSIFFSASAKLDINQTDNFHHFYRLGMSRNDSFGVVTTNYNEAAGLRYDYRHTFDKQWHGLVTSNATASFSQSSPGDSASRGDANVTGTLNYGNTFGDFLVNGSYVLGVSSPVWDSYNSDRGSTISQLATIRYRRQNNPLYADMARLELASTYGYYETQMYSLRYEVTSALTGKDWLEGRLNHRIRRSDNGDTTSSISARGWWNHRFSSVSEGRIQIESLLSSTEDRDQMRNALETRYRTRLFRRRNLYFYMRFRWEQFSEDDQPDSDRMSGAGGLVYAIGKFRATLDYYYSSFDKGNEAKTTDQQIMLELRRSFSLRL
ncbi:MAG TPA: hypothetical protein ENI99_10570 [Sedimenticola sp.]|nr:hypothetical protein [Sedimenticola sp.]